MQVFKPADVVPSRSCFTYDRASGRLLLEGQVRE
jgi:hypothetical protein